MRPYRYTLSLLLLMLALGLACNFVTGGDDPTPVPEVTRVAATTEIPTEEVPTEAPTPTDSALTSPTETEPTTAPPTADAPPDQGVLSLEEEAFVHSDGIFELLVPQGWIAEEKNGGATFAAPDDSGFINVEVTNTGIALDGLSFENFIDARDANLFGDYDAYEILDRSVDQELGVGIVEKTLNFDEIPQHIVSLYDQYGEVIITTDYWSDADKVDVYGETYETIIDSITIDSLKAIELLGTYDWISTFTGPGDLFTIDVPLPWRHVHEEEETVIIDAFYSPDDHAIIENIAYDDGTEISKSEAGAFALELLKEFYASDIRITDDQVQPDGSERLIWNSASGEYSGISFLETRGTTFLLFSVVWDDAFEDAYSDALNYTISSYAVPE